MNIIKTLVAYVALLLCGGAWAAIPVALWNGFTGEDGELTQNGYTWTKSDDTSIADGVVTIGSDGGLTLTPGNSDVIRNNKTLTIVMDVSDIPSDAGDVTILDLNVNNSHASLVSSDSTSETTDDATLVQRWNGGGTYGSLANFDRSTMHRIAFTYHGNGANTYTTGSTTYIDGARAIHAGNLQTSGGGINMINLGAYNNNASNVAAGMKIHNIALFDVKLSDVEVKAFDMAMPTMICNVNKGLTGDSNANFKLQKLRMVAEDGLPVGTAVRVKSLAIGKRSGGNNIPEYLVLNGIKSGSAVNTSVAGVAMSRWDFAGEVVLTMGEEYELKGYNASDEEMDCGFGLYTNCSDNNYKAVWGEWFNGNGKTYAPRYAIDVEVAETPMPRLWAKFDGDFASYGSQTIEWKDTAASFEEAVDGSAVYTGSTTKYPYFENMNWGPATNFTLVGSFKVAVGASQTTPSGLCGIGWSNDGVMLAATAHQVSLVWTGSHVTGTSPIASATLVQDLTAGYHSYALVFDAVQATVKVYVDGAEVLSCADTTISLASAAWKNNNQNRGGILSLPGGEMSGTQRNTATRCDDYRVYGVALTADQVARVAMEQVKTAVARIGDVDYPSVGSALAVAKALATAEAPVTVTPLVSIAEAVTIPENVIIATTTETKLTGAVSGAGTVALDGFATVTRAAGWTGTVWLKNQNINDINFDNYANANSKIKLTGMTGYPRSGSNTYAAKEIILEDEDTTKAYTVNNGYSGSYSKFKKLSGSGTLAQTHRATQAWIFSDAEAFAGKVDSVGHGLVFVAGDTNAIPSEVSGGGLYIAEGQTMTVAAGQEWGIGGAGFVVNGTLKFVEDSSGTGQRVTRWNTGSMSGSGTLDLSEAKGISGNNLRICFKGANHDFMGDITVPANVNFVFAKADATSSGMHFTGGGYICVETANATIGGTWTGTGVYMNGAPETAKLKLAGGTMKVSNQFIIVGNPSFEVVSYGETPALTVTGLFNNYSRQTYALSFPTTVDPTEDETPVIKWGSQQNMTASTFTATAVPAGYDFEFVNGDDFKGFMLNAREGITWQGADGAALTDEDVWNGGSVAEDAAEGRFIFPANESAATVTVAAETPAIGLLNFAGMYTLASKDEATTLNLGLLNLKAGATLTVENLTVVVDELRLQSAEQLVLGANARIEAGTTIALNANETLVIDTSASLQLGLTPSFNANSTIKIANAADLVAGTYCLVSWTNTIDEISGYGLPQLDVEGYAGGLQVRLIPEAKKLWLQVISAEQAARKPLVIMPWGDSITEGINAKGTGANYRIPLCQKLSLAGYNVKTVGYWSVTPKTPAGTLVNGTDPEWCNHSGRGSERLGAKNMGQGSIYDSWANALDQAGEPDIVLLHIGINDMLNNAKNLTADEAFVYLTNVIQKVQAARPNTKFVMSPAMCCEYGHSCQTAAQEGANGDINKTYVKPLYEKALAFFNGVQDGTIAGFDKDRLFFADLYNAVMPRWYANQPETHLNMHAGDHCHPDWAGHDLMAQTWFEQIKKAFPQDANGDYHAPSMDREAALPVTAEMGAAAKTELADFRKGFVKARVLKPTGTEKFTKGTAPTYTETNDQVADDAEIEKVGYFVEYVFPSATTNIHRWVWVDMDAFGPNETKTVADVGLPTMGITQKAVTSLHVFGNHPAVFNTTADATGVEGYLDFGPNDYGTEAAHGEGAPTDRWMNNSWDDKFGTGVYGAMQVHRKLAAGEERDGRAAQVVFAYNGWTGTGANNDFGIGNFGQHFQGGRTMDWTFMGQTATMNASVLQSKTIEIWVKVKTTTPTYDQVTDKTPLEQVVPAEQAEILEKAGVTADKVAAWAKSKGGQSGSTLAGGAIDLVAFALDCAPDEVKAAKESFKVTIRQVDGVWTVECPSRDDYNITPVIKGSATVDGKYELEETDGAARFFKAVIDL